MENKRVADALVPKTHVEICVLNNSIKSNNRIFQSMKMERRKQRTVLLIYMKSTPDITWPMPLVLPKFWLYGAENSDGFTK